MEVEKRTTHPIETRSLSGEPSVARGGVSKSSFLGALHYSPPEGVKFPVDCGWCGIHMEDGTPGAPVSRGICPPCFCREMQEIRQGQDRNQELKVRFLSDAADHYARAFLPLAMVIPWAILGGCL